MPAFKLGETNIGSGQPLYYIADIGANHDGDLHRAFHLIELAKESGAHAAKFQNFRASKIVSRKGFQDLGHKSGHQAKWSKGVYEVYQEASISQEWTSKLKDHCNRVNIEYMTSPYDFQSVDHVDPFVNAFKIGSGDITWLDLIQYIAEKGKPVILATGASSIEDVKRAMGVLITKAKDICLMQCNTNYTGDEDNFRYLNLNVLREFAQLYPNVVLGLSDHTPGHSAVVASIALGARVVEKHFTDDNNRVGPDHRFALDPKAWVDMVRAGNQTLLALGDGIKKIEPNEMETSVIQRRALRFSRNLPAGHCIRKEDLIPVRPIPHEGIPPYALSSFLGRYLSKSVEADELLSEKDCK